MRLLRDVLPPVPTYPRTFDLLIVDEAHNVAPAGRGKYTTDSQRDDLEVVRLDSEVPIRVCRGAPFGA